MVSHEMIDSEEKKSNLLRYGWTAVWLIVFASSLLYAYYANITEYYFDSRYYWNLTDDLFYDGLNPLHILQFPESIRGYFFPVLAGYFKNVFHGVWGWRILSSLSLAFCFSLSLPYAVTGNGIDSLRKILGTSAAYLVFMWIWGVYMQYPLSDFSAFFYLLSAIAFLRISRNLRNVFGKFFLCFAAGIFMYAAYNTRQTFLYGGVLVILAYFLSSRGKMKSALIGAVCILMGMTLLALPQCYINNRHTGSFSPLVNYDLVENEVYKGLTVSRYETYVGLFDYYPRSGVIFDDLPGWQITQRENITEENFRLTKIFKLFLRYPLDMIGIYGRHLFSLMTPVYQQAYISEINAVDPLIIVASILLWLTAGYGIFMETAETGWTLNSLWILSLCLPGLLQVFDEPELRFFLPAYLLCYYEVFAVMSWKKFSRFLKTYWPQVLILSLVILLLWISLTGDTLATKRNGALLINNILK